MRGMKEPVCLLKNRSQLAIHTVMVSVTCKAIRRMSGLQNTIILSCTTWNQHFAT